MAVFFNGMTVNKFWKMVNGNRGRLRTDVFMHWNGRGRYLENNRERINGILAQHRSAVLAISEANLRQGVNDQLVQIQGYKMLDLIADTMMK